MGDGSVEVEVEFVEIDSAEFVPDGEFVGGLGSPEGDGEAESCVGVGVGTGVGVGHGFSTELHSCHEAVSLPPNSFQSAWHRSDQWA